MGICRYPFCANDQRFNKPYLIDHYTGIPPREIVYLAPFSTLVMVNPLGIGSWFIVLAALKKTKIYIPLNITYEILFPVFVIIGAFSYSIIMVAIIKRIKPLFSPGKTAKIIKVLGYLLVFFSIYFLFFSLRAFFNI